LTSRPFLVPFVLLGVFILGWFSWREISSRRQLHEAPVVTVSKQPIALARHTFDPAAPPADMPPLAPGESAECDSNFLSSASVRGETRKMDDTHATVSVTGVKVTLQLNINIWLPAGAAQNMIEHEEGHRQISEYSYQTADKLAERIAAGYIGKQVEITGTDLDAESSKTLQQLASDITEEYNKELSPGPTQRLYDAITDHSRNGVVAKDAVDHAIKNTAVESAQPTTNPGN
jgi:hypothetical protein